MRHSTIAAMLLGLMAVPQPALAARPVERLKVEYTASYPANFYYLINALAGDSKTDSSAYQAYWTRRFGRKAEDERFLDLFRKVRKTYRGGYAEANPPENPFIPLAPRQDAELSAKFSALFLSSNRWEQVWQKAEILLTEEDTATLQRVFTHFQPRFDRVWKEAAYLKGFTSEFRTYSRTLGLDDLMARTAAFYGAPRDRALTMRVNFLFLPKTDVSHGRQLGPHLLVEVQPHEAPKDRIDVVAHEMTHYFFEQAHVDESREILAGLYGTGTINAGAAVGLLNEGLATAVGQGIVQKLASPRTFEPTLGKAGSWYRNEAIDSFAKAIYPVVADALRHDKPLRSTLKGLLAAYRKAVGSQPPSPRGLLTKYALLTDRQSQECFQPFFQELPPTDVFTYDLNEGAEALRTYKAIPALLAVTSQDLPTLRDHLADYDLEGLDLNQLRDKAPCVYAKKRPFSGYVCVVFGTDEHQLSQTLVRFIKLGPLSEGWIPLQ